MKISCAAWAARRNQEGLVPAHTDSRWLARWVAITGWLMLNLGPTDARAVLFFGTADPSYNTTPPGGALLNSGWQYEGSWGGFLGTTIAPNMFITATHVGGSVGGTFVFDGQNYTTTASFASPDSDLTIWQVSGTFSTYAPLYSGSDEVGKSLVVLGLGGQRGSEVTVNELKGWRHGPSDPTPVQRWGVNVVSGIINFGSGIGENLRVAFDSSAGGDEAQLSGGDSGGAVFIEQGGVWKLAGINRAVSGLYSETGQNGSGFSAAIFDEGGLYTGMDGNWHLVTDSSIDIPGNFYATRISSNSEWIASVVPEPRDYALFAALALLGFATLRRMTMCRAHSTR